MTKHPLLPNCYYGDKLQTIILRSLDPYIVTDRDDVANPQLKWNLRKAWHDAELLLAKSTWERKENDDILDIIEIIYELDADNDEQISNMETIIAGFVAYKCMHPESELVFTRIEHKKGGEMSLVIPITVAEILQKMFPEARFTQAGRYPQLSGNIFTRIFKKLGLRK